MKRKESSTEALPARYFGGVAFWLVCWFFLFFLYPLRPPATRRGRYQVAPKDATTQKRYLARLSSGETFGLFFFLEPQAEAPAREEPRGGSRAGLRPALAYRREKEFPYH